MSQLFDKFGRGVLTDPQALDTRGGVPFMRNFAIGNDGLPIALPWLLPMGNASVTFDATMQRGDFPVVSATPTEYSDAGNFWATSPNIPGSALAVYNNGAALALCSLAADFAPGNTFTKLGCGQMEMFMTDAGNMDFYIPVWGAWQAGVGTTPNAFAIARIRWNGTARDATLWHTGAVTPITTGYISGSKFPLYSAIYNNQMWVAGDYSTTGMMRMSIFASAAPTAESNEDFSTITSAGSDGWGANTRRLNTGAITGLRVLGDTLWFFSTGAVTATRGNFQEQQPVNQLLVGDGCPAPGSIVAHGGALYFLSGAGYARLTAGGGLEILSGRGKNRKKTLDTLNAQPQHAFGVLKRFGGSAAVVDNRYWHVYPNGDAWCYDIEADNWSYHDSAFRRNTSTALTSPSAIFQSRDQWPGFAYVETSNMFTGRLAHTHSLGSWVDGLSNYSFQLRSFVELTSVSKDGQPMRLNAVEISIEVGWVNQSNVGTENAIGFEIFNENHETLYRGYAQLGVNIGRRRTIVLHVGNVPPCAEAKLRIFGTASTGDLDVRGSRTTHLKMISCVWYFGNEQLPTIIQDDLIVATPLSSATLYERYQADTSMAAVPADYGWLVRTGGLTDSGGYIRNTATNTAMLATLVTPVLDFHTVHELTYKPGITTGGADIGTSEIVLGLSSDGMNCAYTTIIPTASHEVPLHVRGYVLAGNWVIDVTYYKGGLVGGSRLTIGSQSQCCNKVMRLKITQVTGEGLFIIDHTDTTNTYPTPSASTRAAAYPFGRYGSVALQPIIGMISDAASTNAIGFSKYESNPGQTVVA